MVRLSAVGSSSSKASSAMHVGRTKACGMHCICFSLERVS